MNEQKSSPIWKILISLFIGVCVVYFIAFSYLLHPRIPVMSNYAQRSLLSESFYVYFSKNSYEIGAEQTKVLDKAIADTTLDATKFLYIVGNCSVHKTGEFAFSSGEHALAQKRAEAVTKYVIDHGVPEYIIFILENGSLNANKYGNNDRVELYFK